MHAAAPARRVEDVANMAMFLLSDAAQWITGQIIGVDGGQNLRRGPDYSAMLEPALGADARCAAWSDGSVHAGDSAAVHGPALVGVAEVVMPYQPSAVVGSTLVSASGSRSAGGTSYPSPRMTRILSAGNAMLAWGALSMPSSAATDSASVWAPGP